MSSFLCFLLSTMVSDPLGARLQLKNGGLIFFETILLFLISMGFVWKWN